jgi:hypothetical protein
MIPPMAVAMPPMIAAWASGERVAGRDQAEQKKRGNDRQFLHYDFSVPMESPFSARSATRAISENDDL